jgi:deoxyadenosine/deoxycytidine kinase
MIFSIEGNIGSGKSTLLKKLNKINDKQIVYLQEPVDIWNEIKDINGKTIIEKYYEDNERYAFSFQMMAYISRLSQIRNAYKEGVILITERCIFTDFNVFARMLYDSSKIEEIEFLIYKKWFDEFLKELPIPTLIYIKTTPETCLERVKKRNRKGENIPLEYLQTCHDYHENWINGYSSDVLVLDGENEINVEDIISFISLKTGK